MIASPCPGGWIVMLLGLGFLGGIIVAGIMKDREERQRMRSDD